MYSYVDSRNIIWYLHMLVITLRGSGKEQKIYYFKKTIAKNVIHQVPDGYKVVETKRMGMPLLKKYRKGVSENG